MTPTTLAQLYPAGTLMAQVAGDFRGMPLYLWLRLKLIEQCERWIARADAEARKPDYVKPKWQTRAIAGLRDNHGMKGPGV